MTAIHCRKPGDSCHRTTGLSRSLLSKFTVPEVDFSVLSTSCCFIKCGIFVTNLGYFYELSSAPLFNWNHWEASLLSAEDDACPFLSTNQRKVHKKFNEKRKRINFSENGLFFKIRQRFSKSGLLSELLNCIRKIRRC